MEKFKRQSTVPQALFWGVFENAFTGSESHGELVPGPRGDWSAAVFVIWVAEESETPGLQGIIP